MDREQLATFDRVVREGGFTRAALALAVGQPAVSARIAALEAELGGALLVRGRRLALTALGETFLPYARRALEVLDEGVGAAQGAQVGRRGRVRIGALGSLSGGLLGPALARFAPDHPEVELLVRSGDHERIVTLLLDGLVDLGLVTWPCPEASATDLTPILELREPVILVAAPSHPLARRGAVDEATLAVLGRPHLRLRWWKAHHPAILELAERAGAPADVSMEVALRMIASGVGVGYFPRTLVAEELRAGRLAELAGQPPLHRDSALVRRRQSALSPAAAALVELLRRQADSLGLLVPRRGRLTPGSASRRALRPRIRPSRASPP